MSTVTLVDYTQLKGTPVHDVRSYGAVGDGVHDDLAAIDAATAAAFALGGTVFFPLPPVGYLISDTYNVGNGTGDGSINSNSTLNNIAIVGGGGWMFNDFGTAPPPAPALLWGGTGSDTSMMHIRGPIGGVRISNLMLNGQNVALDGLRIDHAFRSHGEQIGIYGCLRVGMRVQAYQDLASGVNLGCGQNTWKSINMLMSGLNSYGLVVGADSYGAGIFDVARDYFDDIDIQGDPSSGGNGVLVQFADSNEFNNVSIQGWTGRQWLWSATTGNRNFPNGNIVTNAAVASFLSSAWEITGAVAGATTTITAVASGYTLVGEYAYLYGFTGEWRILNGLRTVSAPVDADHFTVAINTTGFTDPLGTPVVAAGSIASNMVLGLKREDTSPATNGPWPANTQSVKGFDNYGILHFWSRMGFNKTSDPSWIIDAAPNAQGATVNGGIRIQPLPTGHVIVSLDNGPAGGYEYELINDLSTGRLQLSAVGGGGVSLEIDHTGKVYTPNLPTSSPGSKGLWYDAGSSNVVKFTP